jgi:acyl-coenzyme A thioesterase PaaI-like protein
VTSGTADLAPWQHEFVRSALAGDYYRWCGVELVSIDRGHARVRFRPRKEMCTLWDTLNGGVMNSLLELPSFLSLLPDLEETEFASTMDIFIQHARVLPADAEYVLEGRLLRRGRGSALTEATAWVGDKACTFARITKNIRAEQPR